MPIKLTYFDIAGAAEKVRLALVVSGTEFEDNRIQREAWARTEAKDSLGPGAHLGSRRQSADTELCDAPLGREARRWISVPRREGAGDRRGHWSARGPGAGHDARALRRDAPRGSRPCFHER